MTADRAYLLELWNASIGEREPGARAQWLYLHGYAQRYPRSAKLRRGESLIDELSRANSGSAAWDGSWRVEWAGDDGRVLAYRQSARQWFEPGEFLTLGGPGHRAQPEEWIRVFAPRESRTLQENFYFVFGETVSPDSAPGGLRIYWNIQQAGAARLIAALTRQLNRFQIPFRFKCVHNEGHFVRLDAAVLYLHRRYWPFAAPLLRRVVDEVGDALEPETPLFTRPLSPGVALAEDPPGGRSFGKNRCAVLAEAIAATPDGSEEEKLAALAAQFRTHGLTLERPYLNAGSRDTYDFS